MMQIDPPSPYKPLRRSTLFVPGSRPDRFLKAVQASPGIVIIDLEDAVAPADKEAARYAIIEASQAVAAACRKYKADFFVRINAGGTAWHDEDLHAMALLPLDGILLPKPISSAQVRHVWEASGQKPLHLLMETTHSFSVIDELARAKGVERLMLGCADLMAELDIDDDDTPLNFYRSLILQHSILNGLQPPIDGVCLALYDEGQLNHEIARAQRFGFGAKACIHPTQVARVEASFAPRLEQIQWAQRVVAASSDGAAASLDGRLIDGPLVVQARRLLAGVM